MSHSNTWKDHKFAKQSPPLLLQQLIYESLGVIVPTLKITRNCLRLILNQVSTAETDVHKNSKAQLANSNATWPKRLDKIHEHALQQNKLWTILFLVILQYYWDAELEEFQRRAARVTKGMLQPSLSMLRVFYIKRGKEGREEEGKKNNQLRGTAIVEVYKIVRGTGRLGREQQVIASSNKGPEEQQLKLTNFKVIKEGNCSYNIVKLQNSLLQDAVATRSSHGFKARLDSLMKEKPISSLLKEIHRNTLPTSLRCKLLDVGRVIHASTALYFSQVYVLPQIICF